MPSSLFTRFSEALTSPKGIASLLAAVAALWVLALIGNSEPSSPTATKAVTPASASSTSAPAASQASAPAPTTPSNTNFTQQQEKAIHQIVRAYLLKNPELLEEMSRALQIKRHEQQRKKAEQVIAANKKSIYRSPGDYVYGNPKGDITIVEYFDYNCGWCKRALSQVIETVKSDPNVRVVMKEYPVFGGPPSIAAAKAAMASIKQNKYWEFHVALMRQQQVTEDTIWKVAKQVGLDVKKLKADMQNPEYEKYLRETIAIGQEMGIRGTPGFLIDSRLSPGFLNTQQIKQMLADIRKKGCKIC